MPVRESDKNPTVWVRLTPEQQEALDLAKTKAERQTNLLPTNKAIVDRGLADFCERYGVSYPIPERRWRRKTPQRKSAA